MGTTWFEYWWIQYITKFLIFLLYVQKNVKQKHSCSERISLSKNIIFKCKKLIIIKTNLHKLVLVKASALKLEKYLFEKLKILFIYLYISISITLVTWYASTKSDSVYLSFYKNNQ